MAYYKVTAVSEDFEPLAGVKVAALDLSDGSIADIQSTTLYGEAVFSGLVGPHFFRVHAIRTSATVGGRIYTGRIQIQVVSLGAGPLYDYVVDINGMGTHEYLGTTDGALAQAITDGADRSIWMMNSETLTQAEELGAIADDAHISIHAAEGGRVKLSAKAATALFKVTTGTTWGTTWWGGCGYDVRNIWLSCDSGQCLFDVNNGVGGNGTIFLDNCMLTGGDVMDVANSIQGPSLHLRRCRNGSSGVNDVLQLGASATVDELRVEDCRLSMAELIDGTGMPDRTFVSGGWLSVSVSILNTSTTFTEFYVSGVWLKHTGATTLFTTGASIQSVEDLIIVGCYYEGTNASSVFGNFGSYNVNQCDGLTITGNTIVNTVGGGTAITVDTDWQNVQVLNSYRGWTTEYTGPASTIWETLALSDLDLSGTLTVDVINEHTAATGVTIETTLLKDGVIYIGGDANAYWTVAANVVYFVMDANDYITYARAGNAWSFKIGGVESLGINTAGIAVTIGAVYVGVDDTTVGNLILYGGAADTGGTIYLYLGANADGTFQYFQIDAYQDDMRWVHNGAVDLYLYADRSVGIVTGPLKVDTINEYTGDAGVTIDGLSIKDSSAKLDSSPDSDHTVSGLTCTRTAGTALTFGQVCYMGADGKMEKGDADSAATATIWAMVADATIAEDATGTFLLMGFARDDTWDWTVGATLYLDTATAGGMTETAPSGTDDVVKICGYAVTADIVYFKPEMTMVVHA